MASMDNDKKKELLIAFNQNAELKEAVYEELMAGVFEQGVVREGRKLDPLRNWALSLVFQQGMDVSNEQLGADLRAAGEGIRYIQTAWDRITENYQPTPEKGETDGKNPAR